MRMTNVVCGLAAGLMVASCGSTPSSEPMGSNGSALSASISADGGCAGVGSVVCVNGGHWDPQLCMCVPADAGCVDNVLCIAGDHWDPVLCMCVPDDAGACVSSEDGPCGGFVVNPCTCATGLACKPNSVPDIPGTCEPTSCCPSSWTMYTCNEENGTTGLNCHNPQLACASSLTCGGGCDTEVQGRCPVCDPLVCKPGKTWDPTRCRCVAGCTTAADCTGPLPNLCVVCDGGGDGCAHWTCVGGKCETAYCQ